MKRTSSAIRLALFAGAVSVSCTRSSPQESKNLTVSVATSLRYAMSELARSYEGTYTDARITLNFGGSGTLAQQIEHGAPSDVVLSAAPKPMDTLAAKGLILPETRRNLLRNEIVLPIPKDSA